MSKRKLGEVLQHAGKISQLNLERAIEEQKSKVARLGEVLFENSLVEKDALVSALIETTGIPYVDSSAVKPDPAALRALPVKIAERFNVLPLRFENKMLVIVMADPQDLEKLSQIQFSVGCQLSPRFGFRSEVARAVRVHYGLVPAGEIEQLEVGKPEIEFFSSSKRQSNVDAMQELQAELLNRKTPAVEEAAAIIIEAIGRNASDIHIEPLASETVVRLRLDGVLHELKRLPRQIHVGLISRVKILCDMDIAERRNPQDGRFMAKIAAKQYDVRVSTLPTQLGEKVVMRILDGSANLKHFSELGFPSRIEHQFSDLIALPQGMLLVTGPTGSGKSSTLSAAICALQKPSVNIVTIEDPVEYEIPGINQVSINTKAGMTFAGTLRAILRQDPNVIMVGEIRDVETAEIAMKATQTGHFVLSTLHTNGAAESVIRLLDLGVQSYLITTSLTGILAQRLVRRLCKCHTKRPMTPELAQRMAAAGILEPPPHYRTPLGCADCNQTGYRGRVGLYEFLVMTEAIRDAVRSTEQLGKLRSLSRSLGMRTMREDGLDKVVQGITTLEEIFRVVPKDEAIGVVCENCGRPLMADFRFCPTCGTRAAQTKPAVQLDNVPISGEVVQ